VESRCKACRHPQLAAIDSALVARESERIVATQYGLTQACVHRHAVSHLPKSLVRAAERDIEKHGNTLFDEVVWLVAEARKILAGSDDPDQKLRAMDRILKGLDLRGRVTGEIQPPQISALFVTLGVNGEDELKRLVERDRALTGYHLDDAERDGVAALRLVLAEHPERAADIRRALFGEQEVDATIE
jgi:hypothetical protein